MVALERGDWAEARRLLADALAADAGVEPEHLAALAEAAWWESDVDTTVAARERAFRMFRDAGRWDDAAIMALEVAHDHALKGRTTVAGAWTGRAREIVGDRPRSLAAAHLARAEARDLFEGNGDLQAALVSASDAIELAREHGDRDIEMVALHDRGRILTALGSHTDGRAQMDEAMLAATSGELQPMTVGRIYCNMIGLCLDTADFDAAAEWSEEAERWCHSSSLDSGYPGICRVKRSEINRRRGLLDAAEAGARKACEELVHFIPFVAAAHAEMGNVHLQRGDLDGATAEFGKAHELGHHAMPGMALLRRARGDAAAGYQLITAALLSLPETATTRAQLLPAAVELALEVGDGDGANAFAVELEALAARLRSRALLAAAEAARGRVDLSQGDTGGAVRRLRGAFGSFALAGLPYDSARARLALGRALLAAGQTEAAHLEIRAASSEFDRLEAPLDLQEAVSVLAPATSMPDARVEARTLLEELSEVALARYRIVGAYARFDDDVRNALADARQRIRAGLAVTSQRRENHLVWAAPGSGKSFFVQEIAAEQPDVAFVEINLAQTDEAAFRDGLATAVETARPTLVLVDEIDARPEASWPYEALLPVLDANVGGGAHLVVVMAGSGGMSIDDLRTSIASRPKGADLLSRTPLHNDLVIAPLGVGDQVLVALSQMAATAAASGQRIRSAEKAALFYAAVTPYLANARQLGEFVGQAVRRMPVGEDRLKFDHLFSPGDPENKRFWEHLTATAPTLVSRFVTIG